MPKEYYVAASEFDLCNYQN